MELQQIRYFAELAQTLNFTRAAERCHVTQPALTRAINKLESELGGSLIVRNRRNPQLTPLGRELADRFFRLNDEVTQIRVEARKFYQVSKNLIRVRISRSLGTQPISDFIAIFGRRNEDVVLDFRSAANESCTEALATGDADLAFVAIESFPDEVSSVALYAERLMLALPLGHDLARLRCVAPQRLDRERAIEWLDGASASRIRCILDRLPRVGVSNINGNDLDVARAMVSAGLGFAIVPEYMADCGDLVLRMLDVPNAEYQVGLARALGRPLPHSADLFLRAARLHGWPR